MVVIRHRRTMGPEAGVPAGLEAEVEVEAAWGRMQDDLTTISTESRLVGARSTCRHHSALELGALARHGAARTTCRPVAGIARSVSVAAAVTTLELAHADGGRQGDQP